MPLYWGASKCSTSVVQPPCADMDGVTYSGSNVCNRCCRTWIRIRHLTSPIPQSAHWQLSMIPPLPLPGFLVCSVQGRHLWSARFDHCRSAKSLLTWPVGVSYLSYVMEVTSAFMVDCSVVKFSPPMMEAWVRYNILRMITALSPLKKSDGFIHLWNYVFD